jgi:hypothetical protein
MEFGWNAGPGDGSYARHDLEANQCGRPGGRCDDGAAVEHRADIPGTAVFHYAHHRNRAGAALARSRKRAKSSAGGSVGGVSEPYNETRALPFAYMLVSAKGGL